MHGVSFVSLYIARNVFGVIYSITFIMIIMPLCESFDISFPFHKRFVTVVRESS